MTWRLVIGGAQLASATWPDWVRACIVRGTAQKPSVFVGPVRLTITRQAPPPAKFAASRPPGPSLAALVAEIADALTQTAWLDDRQLVALRASVTKTAGASIVHVCIEPARRRRATS